MISFRATQDFFSAEVESQYVSGLTYTVWPENVLLALLAQKWMREGKVELIKETLAKLSGTAEVKE